VERANARQGLIQSGGVVSKSNRNLGAVQEEGEVKLKATHDRDLLRGNGGGQEKDP